MQGIKPSKAIWARINDAIVNENAAEVLVTMISGASAILVEAKVCRDEQHARVHLAAMILSPDTGKVGSLLPKLQAELSRIDDGKWIT